MKAAIGGFVPCRWLLLAVVLATLGAAAQTPNELLKSKGLTLLGERYLLPADAGLAEWLKQVRAAEHKVEDSAKRRSNLERDISAMEATANDLYADWVAEKQKLARISRNADGTYNMQVGVVNGLRAKILKVLDVIKQRQAVLQTIGDPSDDYVAITLKFGAAIDATTARYQALASDPEVKAAIDKLNAGRGAKVALGPSERLKTELPAIAKLRERVNSETISFDTIGGVPTVPVTLNDHVTVHAVVDSGAASVSISAKVAKQIGLVPGPEDKVTHVVTADGSVVEVRQMIIKSIRLGRFTVENVECFVQPDNGREADTLLGGSFLRRFVYRMDLGARQLKLSQIADAAADEASSTGALAPTVKPAAEGAVSPSAWKITIVEARYGRGSKWIDVTDALRSAIARDPYMPIAPDDDLMDGQPDPAVGQSKSLHVVYLAGGERREDTVGQGQQRAPSKCPPEGIRNPAAGRELKITAARYGDGIHWLDLTDLIRRKVSDPRQPFDLTNDEVGQDPHPNHTKRLIVWFSYAGRDYMKVTDEYNGIHDAKLIPQ